MINNLVYGRMLILIKALLLQNLHIFLEGTLRLSNDVAISLLQFETVCCQYYQLASE